METGTLFRSNSVIICYIFELLGTLWYPIAKKSSNEQVVSTTKKTSTYVIVFLLLLLVLGAIVLANTGMFFSSKGKHTVQVTEAEHSAMTARQQEVAEGKNLTVTVYPETGYRVAFVHMEYDGHSEYMSEKVEHVYSAAMPDSDVTVSATVLPEGTYGVEAHTEDDILTLRPEPAAGSEGDEMTLHVQVPSGYRIRSVTADPETLSLHTVQGSGVFTFRMPSEDVVLTVKAGVKTFQDVESSWYEPYIYDAVEKGYMTGLTDTVFEPDQWVNRAQAAQALYTMAGKPNAPEVSSFADVDPDKWYAQAIAWCGQMKLLEDVASGTFRPADAISRQDLAAIMHRYASDVLSQETAERSSLTEFSDTGDIASYALASMKWAVGTGLLEPVEEGMISPNEPVSRAQLAVMLLKLSGEEPDTQVTSEQSVEEAPEWDDYTSGLTDVAENAWYRDGVNYVIAHNIMGPLSETEFLPNNLVTRKQVVRILHNMAGRPEADGTLTFTDLPDDEGYRKAVLWCVQKDLIHGYDETTFQPNAVITRQQFVAILHKYAAYRNYDLSSVTTLDAFQDAGRISGYALEPMRWAVQKGIVQGSRGYLNADESLTRAQVACMVHTFCTNVANEGS